MKFCGTSPIKFPDDPGESSGEEAGQARSTSPGGAGPRRRRRTKAEITSLRTALYRLAAELHPCTVRQLFYQMVSLGHIPKTESAYKATVARLLITLRREGIIPFSWITDGTRWMRKPRTYDGLSDALAETARYYRRALWSQAPVYVEVWVEKDALAGVIYEVTSEYDVPLMVGRGFCSLSYLYRAAEDMREIGKPVYIYYLADHDPSGIAAMRAAERDLRGFTADIELHFTHAAVTWEQVVSWDLPTRPTKMTDSRARRYGARPSVELDAIPPDRLRALVRECIEQHIDPGILRRAERIEAAERAVLEELAAHGWPTRSIWTRRRPGGRETTGSS